MREINLRMGVPEALQLLAVLLDLKPETGEAMRTVSQLRISLCNGIANTAAEARDAYQQPELPVKPQPAPAKRPRGRPRKPRQVEMPDGKVRDVGELKPPPPPADDGDAP